MEAALSSNIQILPNPGARYKSLKSMLPVEVKILERYITWIEELAGHIEKSAISNDDSLENYIQIRLKAEISENGQRNEADNEIEADAPGGVSEETEDSGWDFPIERLAWLMNLAAMYTYLGDFTSAKKHLDYLQAQNLDNLNLTDKHRQVIEHCRDSFAWAISILIGHEEVTMDANVKYEEELCDDEDKQVKATLTFFKVCLGLSMQVSDGIVLELLQEAIEFDEHCHIWYHYAYRIKRRFRRGAESGPALLNPSNSEVDLAHKAYKHSSDNFVVICDRALSLQETMKKNKMDWISKKEFYRKCVELYEKALDLAIKTENKKWSRKIKIYLAELLLKGDTAEKYAGVKLLQDCGRDYPNSTVVFHKLGKLYHHYDKLNIGSNEKTDDHIELARKCYKQAIDNDPGNHSCVMDYLKLLKKLNDYSEMIASIDRALEHCKRDFMVAKLCVVKAYITWIYNPNQLSDPRSTALKLWLHVLENFPRYDNNIYVAFDPIYFGQNHSAYGVHAEILKYLEIVLKDRENSKEAMLIKDLMNGFTKSPNYPWSNLNRNYERRTQDSTNGVDGVHDMSNRINRLSLSSHGNRRQRQHQRGRGPNNVKRRHSAADKDKNWRE